MSGLIDQAGLTAGAGLSNGAGLYKYANFNPFDPTDLDPYLLFDTAAGSMIGTLENPTLDLDPTNQETLDVITASRSSVATRTLPDGRIALAEQDTVRVDHVDGVPMILVEPSATNLLPYSEDFSHAGWSKNYDVVVTSSSVNSPDGTTNAFKITGLESTEGGDGLLERVGASASTTYTFSAYLKALDNDDVGKKVRIRLKRNGGALVASNQQVVLSSEWVRHSVSITLLSDNTGVDSMITKDASSPTAERADECLIWGAQLEESSVATSYIPTAGGDAAARTRAADDLVISGSAFTEFFNGSEGTFYIEVLHTRTLIDAAYISGQSSNQYFMYRNRSDNNLNSFDGGSAETVVNIPSDALFRAAVTYSTTNKTLSMNGTTASEGSINSNWAATNILNIGQGDDGQIGGRIKRLIYWPTSSDRL